MKDEEERRTEVTELGNMVFSEEHCVMCGAVIPEGRQVCMECERNVMQRAKTEEKRDEKKSGWRKAKNRNR